VLDSGILTYGGVCRYRRFWRRTPAADKRARRSSISNRGSMARSTPRR